jgi:hypothetical protein
MTISFPLPLSDTEAGNPPASVVSISKHCPACMTLKPMEDFYRDKRRKYGRHQYCKKCHDGRSTNNDPRKRHLLATYGITQEQYEALYIKQGRVCAICGQPETRKHHKTGTLWKLSVDHDHTTGQVRGLLCERCNRGLGLCEENISQVLKYLQK